MANEVKMPQLSDTMHSGKIVTWNKKVGDTIKRGDILAEVETDKANLEIESFQNGTLLEIRTQAESTANVGEVICVIGEANESVASTPNASTSTISAPSSSISHPPLPPSPTPAPAPPASLSMATPVSAGDRIIASPLAKKIAQTHDVNLESITGSGPNGRIVKKDVETVIGTSGDNAVHQKPVPALLKLPITATVTPIQVQARAIHDSAF